MRNDGYIDPALAAKYPQEAAAFEKAKRAAIAAVDQKTAEIGDRDACGFAWAEVRPGNSRLATFLKKAGVARPGWAGGVTVWNPGNYGGQAISVIEAGAVAFARVLQAETGQRDIRASSRLD